ncbi:hypothetical protein, partial [Cytobacillus praedii]|uniref:hypothetical protein n=1 Tax=Cytobacillus praedii TaxID=1742358 RepID=UPI001E438A6C
MPFGNREILFFPFRGIIASSLMTVKHFFLFYGHHCFSFVTVKHFFPRLRASLLLFDDRETLFFSFTGIIAPLCGPLNTFFLVYGHHCFS